MMEKRTAKRFMVQHDKYYVRASGSGKVLGTILDISICGLSFCYPLEAIMYEENGKLDILQENKGIILEKIAYENCYDFEVPQSSRIIAIGARRRGVQFQNSLCDLIQLESYFGFRAQAVV